VTDHIKALRVEPISKTHLRNEFSCGKPELDHYLQRFARQNDEKNITKSFVAVDADGCVLGYYSLSTASIEFATLPEDIRLTLPAYPVPAARLARLAVDASMKGQGLGAKLLIDALQRIASVSQDIAVKVILVDAKDEEARDFYQHFGFIQLPEQDLKLFLPIETVMQLF
jgi:predicted N-acetyltransferase YhbS